eukprot:XP_001705219.1 Hypothetical protein GL50803_38689 [Giardia lamblia ATCC 50803]
MEVDLEDIQFALNERHQSFELIQNFLPVVCYGNTPQWHLERRDPTLVLAYHPPEHDDVFERSHLLDNVGLCLKLEGVGRKARNCPKVDRAVCHFIEHTGEIHNWPELKVHPVAHKRSVGCH